VRVFVARERLPANSREDLSLTFQNRGEKNQPAASYEDQTQDLCFPFWIVDSHDSEYVKVCLLGYDTV
jgi:hypothetical protein